MQSTEPGVQVLVSGMLDLVTQIRDEAHLTCSPLQSAALYSLADDFESALYSLADEYGQPEKPRVAVAR